MGKGNDKKVVREARHLLLSALGNLLESDRERKFRRPHQKQRPLSRDEFCAQKHLPDTNVSFIETGRFLDLDFAHLRLYLANTYGKSDVAFVTSVKKVYDGLKELDKLLKKL